MLISLSSFFVCIFAFLISSIFGSGLYFFISAFAIIVLNIEILSLFGAISPVGIFILNILSLTLTFVFWHRAGRPLLKFKIDFKKYFNAIKLDKSLAVLSLGFIFLMFVNLVLASFVSVNDLDAQSYHALRAIVFSQQGSLAHFEIADVRNLVMPINSEIFYTWIYTLTKTDVGFGLFSYFSYMLALGSLWGILSHYKYSLRKKLWCIFILSSLAGVIAQISSTQTDIAIGALYLAALLFYLKYNENNKHYLYFSTLAIALAMGVKSTGVIILIPFLLLLFYIKKANRAVCLRFFGFLALNFFIFSSYNYILNFISFGTFLGSPISIERHRFIGGPQAVLANFIRYMIQFLDFSGFTWGNYLNDKILSLQTFLLNSFHIPESLGVVSKMEEVNSALSEQTIGFGILGFSVFLPCTLYAFFSKNKKLRHFGILFFLCIVMLSASICYMVFSIRFITAFVILSAPVFIFSYFKKMNPLKFLIIIFALYYMTLVSTHLVQRPYFKLVKFYKETNTFSEFADRVRCFDLPFHGNKPHACVLRDNLLSKGSKNVAFFSDAHFEMTPFKLSELKVDTLLLERLESYDYNKYDTVVLPCKFQKSHYDTKNSRKDYEIIKRAPGELPEVIFNTYYDPRCIFFDRDAQPTKSDKVAFSICYLTNPQKYFSQKNFKIIESLNIEKHRGDKIDKNCLYVFKKI